MAAEVPENIDRFNRLVLATLTALYQSFPEPVTLDAHVLGVSASGDNFESEDGQQRAFAWMDSARATIVWLGREGFLVYSDQMADGGFLQVVLSAKGLATLGQVPKSLKENPEHESIGAVASKTLKSGAKEMISDLVKELISIGIKATMGG